MTSPSGFRAGPPSKKRPLSPSQQVLQELEVSTAVAQVEARLDSLEIDIAREAGSREEDARHIAGEMAVMKARVEDMVGAFAAVVEEIRASKGRGPGRAVSAEDRTEVNIEALRKEMKAPIAKLRRQISASVAAALLEMQQALEQLKHELGFDGQPGVPDGESEGHLETAAAGAAKPAEKRTERGSKEATPAARTDRRLRALEARVDDGFERLGQALLRVADGVSEASSLSQRLAEAESRLSKLATGSEPSVGPELSVGPESPAGVPPKG